MGQNTGLARERQEVFAKAMMRTSVTSPDGWTRDSTLPDRLTHEDGRIRFMFEDGSFLDLPEGASVLLWESRIRTGRF